MCFDSASCPRGVGLIEEAIATFLHEGRAEIYVFRIVERVIHHFDTILGQLGKSVN